MHTIPNGKLVYEWFFSVQMKSTNNNLQQKLYRIFSQNRNIHPHLLSIHWASLSFKSARFALDFGFHCISFGAIFFSTAEPIFFSLLQHFLFNQQKCIDFTHTGFNQKVNREKTSSNELLNCAQRFLKHEIFHLRLYLCNPKHNITCFT